MAASAALLAKRALLIVMRAIASAYDITLNCNRDSKDKVIPTDFRKLALRVHPDRGGLARHQKTYM